MKGRFGVPMSAIDKIKRKRWCKQCKYFEKESKKRGLCKLRSIQINTTKSVLCKNFAKKAKPPKAGECVCYTIDELEERRRNDFTQCGAKTEGE